MKQISCTAVLLFFCLSQICGYAQGKKEVVYYNWKDYTDNTVLEDFEKKTGIKVILKEYETREEMISEVQSNPGEYDVINASDSSVSSLIQYRLVAELDLTKIPNRKFIKEHFRHLPYDPEGKYSLAGSLWGSVGLVINTNFVPADTDSWSVFLDEKYKNKIALLDDYRDALGGLLKISNFSANSTDPRELEQANANALLLSANGVQFGDVISNIEKVMGGEIWIAQAFTSDIYYYLGDRKDIKAVLPKEGFCITVDNYTVSVDSTRKEESFQFINFLIDPQNAAKTANLFRYPSTVQADAFIEKALLDNPLLNLSQDLLNKGEYIVDVNAADGEYARIFNLMKQVKEN